MRSSLQILNAQPYGVSAMLKIPNADNGQQCVVIECGNGTMKSLDNDFDFLSVTDIVLSHPHDDHTSDAAALIREIIKAVEESDGYQDLYLWGPKGTVDQVTGDTVRLMGEKVAKWRKRGIRLVKGNEKHPRGITIFPVLHNKRACCCGMMASLDGVCLLYPGDYGNQNDWQKIAKKYLSGKLPNVAISEATEGIKQSTPYHSSCVGAQEFFGQFHVPKKGRRIIWHIRESSGVEKWAKTHGVIVAKTGMVIEL